MSLVDTFADFIADVPKRNVTLPFGDTAVWEMGEGDPLILLHGIAGGRRLFFRVVPELAKQHRVIVPHLRGEERPDPSARADDYLDDIAALLDGLENVTLFGASFGGYLALAYAGRNDPRVKRVCAQGAFLGYKLGLLDRITMVASAAMPASWGSAYYAWRVLRGRENAILSSHHPELEPLNLGWQRATPFESLRRRAKLISQQHVGPAVARSSTPIVLGHGRRDPVVPLALGQQIAKARDDIELTIWEDGGHMQMLTHPERFSALALPGA